MGVHYNHDLKLKDPAFDNKSVTNVFVLCSIYKHTGSHQKNLN